MSSSRPFRRPHVSLAATLVAAVLATDGNAAVVSQQGTTCVRTTLAIKFSEDPPTVLEDCPASRDLTSYNAPTLRQERGSAFAQVQQSVRLTSPGAPTLLRLSSQAFAQAVGDAETDAGALTQLTFEFRVDAATAYDFGAGLSLRAQATLAALEPTETFLQFCIQNCTRSGTLAPGLYRVTAQAGDGSDAPTRSYNLAFELRTLATPSPIPTATPNGEITWINPAGGAYATAENWNPPTVPGSVPEREDTAVFNLMNTYAVNVAGARAKRMIIRNSSIDLVGGTAEVTAGSLAEPSLVVGQNGKLHLVSGTFTSVHTILGDISTGLAEVDLISGTPIWSNTGRLTIGDAGPAQLTVVAGEVTSAEARIGGGLLGHGDAIVGGPGKWTTGNLGLGFGGGRAALVIRDGGVVNSSDAFVGIAGVPSTQATLVEVHDADATWTLSGTLNVGAGTDVGGGVDVANGGDVVCNALTIGGSFPAMTLSDAGSTLSVTETTTVGRPGGDGTILTGILLLAKSAAMLGNTLRVRADGIFQLEDGGTADFDEVDVADGQVFVAGKDADGHPSRLKAFDGALVAGTLEVGSDGIASLQTLVIGDEVAPGLVTVDPGTSGSATLEVTVGTLVDDGALDVQDGGTATIGGTLGIGLRGTGFPEDGANLVNVFGGGSARPASLIVDGGIDVGIGKPAELVVGTQGDLVRAASLAVGASTTGTGKVFVQDGARLECTGNAVIGDIGPGTALILGVAIPNPVLHVDGTLDVGVSAPGTVELDRGVLEAGSTTTVHSQGAIVGSGSVTAAVVVEPGGCFAVSARPSASPGCGAAPGSPLRLPSDVPRVRRFASAARVPEVGPTARAAVVPPATLVLDGNLVVGPGATLRIEIDGTAGGLQVTGNATLNGNLEIAFVDGFVPRAGDDFPILDVLGALSGIGTDPIVTGLPAGWKGDATFAGGKLALEVFGDYLCYQTAAAKGAKFPKDLQGTLPTGLGALDFGIEKPSLLCNPSGPSTGSQQGNDTRLRGYTATDLSADPLAIVDRTLRVTNGLHPNGELLVDTSVPALVLAAAAKCGDVPPGTCPADLAPPPETAAFVCARAKRSKTGAAFPKNVIASAIDAFGEPRTYTLAKPTRVCAPTTGDFADALACYAAKPLGKACSLAAPSNAAGACKSEIDCGGTKKVTHFCVKQGKHVKVGSLVLATTLARDRATTTKPVELCVPATLTAP